MATRFQSSLPAQVFGSDLWYAFLATFTTTQLCDAVLWTQQDHPGGGSIACTPLNHVASRWVIPPVVFFQPVVLSMYPSDAGHVQPQCLPVAQRCRLGLSTLCLAAQPLSRILPSTKTSSQHLWGGVCFRSGSQRLASPLVRRRRGLYPPVRYGLQILLQVAACSDSWLHSTVPSLLSRCARIACSSQCLGVGTTVGPTCEQVGRRTEHWDDGAPSSATNASLAAVTPTTSAPKFSPDLSRV